MVIIMNSLFDTLRTWAEIDTDALLYNFNAVRKHVPENVKVAAVIKANAYGHGAVRIAHELENTADYFAVAMTDEAAELRRSGIKLPIMVLGHTPPSDYPVLAGLNIETTVTSFEEAEQICAYSASHDEKIGFHIALDTGMSRIGFLPCRESAEEIERISKLPGADIRGVFSHYASADSADKAYAVKQTEVFKKFTDEIEEMGVTIPLKHLCNSAAAIEMTDKFDMVRAGIVLYGLKPSDEVELSLIGGIHSVMSLRTHVSHVKTVPAGVPVSYGCTYVTDKETVIATLSAGYADGIPRALSNKGEIILHGKKAPVIGRICMDQMMVDVTDIPDVKAGDTATVFGKDGECEITADDVADAASTIGYEIVCAVSRRVVRVYLKNGKPDQVLNSLIG